MLRRVLSAVLVALIAGPAFAQTRPAAKTGAPGGGTTKGVVGPFSIEPGGKKDLGDVRIDDRPAPEPAPTR